MGAFGGGIFKFPVVVPLFSIVLTDTLDGGLLALKWLNYSVDLFILFKKSFLILKKSFPNCKLKRLNVDS